ncbi:MAG: indole-3-glycerol-phosphate synthase [Thermoproteota archaeon]
MLDYLDILAQEATKTIKEGYYEGGPYVEGVEESLKKAILNCKRNPVISEIKFASPSSGRLRDKAHPRKVAMEMEEGGAIGISVLTEPKRFQGQIEFISQIRGLITIPLLMKDIIVSQLQIEAASKMGANAVLLIQALFQRGYCPTSVQGMISYAHSRGLEVLLEAHTEEEFLLAIDTDADMIGVNNRDLRTLNVDLKVTERILTSHLPTEKVIVSESGINSAKDIHRLRQYGAQAVLVGTAIMRSEDIRGRVKELVEL